VQVRVGSGQLGLQDEVTVRFRLMLEPGLGAMCSHILWDEEIRGADSGFWWAAQGASHLLPLPLPLFLLPSLVGATGSQDTLQMWLVCLGGGTNFLWTGPWPFIYWAFLCLWAPRRLTVNADCMNKVSIPMGENSPYQGFAIQANVI
jgi:hypothetical protein